MARCPDSNLIGHAVLPDYEFRINGRGVATIVPKPGSSVHGLVWSVTNADVHALDRFEGVSLSLYERTSMVVQGVDGSKYRAYLYVAADDSRGEPRPGYLERIVAAARAHGFPTDYVQVLESWRRTD